MKTAGFGFQSSLFYFSFNRHTATIIAYSRLSVQVVALNKSILCFKDQEKFCGMLKSGAPRWYPSKKNIYQQSFSSGCQIYFKTIIFTCNYKLAKALLVGHCQKSD